MNGGIGGRRVEMFGGGEEMWQEERSADPVKLTTTGSTASVIHPNTKTFDSKATKGCCRIEQPYCEATSPN